MEIVRPSQGETKLTEGECMGCDIVIKITTCIVNYSYCKATPSDTLVSGPPPASDFIFGFLSHYFYYACA